MARNLQGTFHPEHEIISAMTYHVQTEPGLILTPVLRGSSWYPRRSGRKTEAQGNLILLLYLLP